MDNGGYQDKLLTKVTGGLHRKKGGEGVGRSTLAPKSKCTLGLIKILTSS